MLYIYPWNNDDNVLSGDQYVEAICNNVLRKHIVGLLNIKQYRHSQGLLSISMQYLVMGQQSRVCLTWHGFDSLSVDNWINTESIIYSELVSTTLTTVYMVYTSILFMYH